MTNNPPEIPPEITRPLPEDTNPQSANPAPKNLPPQQIMAMIAAQNGMPYPGGAMIPPMGIPLLLSHQQIWQGQYTPPEAIEKYEKILPGVFGRMVGMAEQLQTAQIESNNRAQNYLQLDTRRAHYLGFIVSIAALIGAVILAILGHPTVAVVCLSVPVMAVAVAFINSTKKEMSVDVNDPVIKQ